MAASSVTSMLSVSPGLLIQIFDFVAELEGALLALRIFKSDAALLRIQGNNSSSYLVVSTLTVAGVSPSGVTATAPYLATVAPPSFDLSGIMMTSSVEGGYLHAVSGVELIEVLDALVDAVGFGPAVIQVNDKLAPVRIHLLDGAGGFCHFNLVDGLRLVVLLLRNGAGPRADQ